MTRRIGAMLPVFVGVLMVGTALAGGAGDSVTLKVGGHERVGSLELTFTTVTEDSRCPEGVSCVWAGEAIVALQAEAGGTRAQLTLSTATGDRHAGGLGGYRITLEKLVPTPRQDGRPITDYVATLGVTAPASAPASPAPPSRAP